MIDAESKLYVQLAPDEVSLAVLLNLQRQLPLTDQNRLVPASQLHLTILHIGLVSRMIAAMRPHTNLSDNEVIKRAEQLVTVLGDVVKSTFQTITLRLIGVDYFGPKRNTFVLTLATTPQLSALHKDSLLAFQDFFADCGINDINAFMRSDSNLVNALTLRPHVALAKAYVGQSNILLPATLSFVTTAIV